MQKYIYGMHAVTALLASKPEMIREICLSRKKISSDLEKILAAAKTNGIIIRYVTQQKLDQIIPEACHQGITAEVRGENIKNYEEKDLDFLLENLMEPPYLLLLDGVQDPHNLGACLRTANAAGVHAVIAPRDRAVGMTPVVRKVACGAAEMTPFIPVANLARTMHILKERGVWMYGATAEAEKNIYETELKGALAIVLGGEGQGLRRLTRDSCDFLISIPMPGAMASLNVSVAAGICLFEALRQRGGI